MRAALCLLLSGLLAVPGAAQDTSVPGQPDGVTRGTRTAIEKGLSFLALHQNADGSWNASGGYGRYPTVMTSLAGLALISSGSTPSRGPHAKNVRKAASFILSRQEPGGLFAEEGRSMYGHGFSVLFLSQVYGMEEDARKQARIKQALRAAIDLIARAQSGPGGWYYTPDSRNDEGSVTVTQVQALRGCRNAGLHVPKETIDRAIKYIERSQNPDGGIAYRATGRGASRPAISAAACAVLYNAGKYDSPAAKKCFKYAWQTCKPGGGGSGGFYFYSQLYMSQACWQMGDKHWKPYYRDIQKRLLRTQQGNGAWQGDGVGLVYGTAIGLLILQLPYNNLPILSR